MWLVMRGAMSATVRRIHQTYYLPSMTGIATAIYENLSEDMPEAAAAAARTHAMAQVAGVEQLEGTYPFDLERSVRCYRLNRFLHDLILPERRAAFNADPETEFERAGLPEIERDLVRRRDWQGLIRYGAIFFVLEKLAAVSGVSNIHVYAAMRGQTVEAFQKTRNAQVQYSVGGQEAHAKIEANAKT